MRSTVLSAQACTADTTALRKPLNGQHGAVCMYIRDVRDSIYGKRLGRLCLPESIISVSLP